MDWGSRPAQKTLTPVEVPRAKSARATSDDKDRRARPRRGHSIYAACEAGAHCSDHVMRRTCDKLARRAKFRFFRMANHLYNYCHPVPEKRSVGHRYRTLGRELRWT